MNDIHPLKDPIDIPFFSLMELAVLFFIASFIVFRLLTLVWRAYQVRRARRAQVSVPQKKGDPFLEELEHLQVHIDSEEFKEFSHRATDVLKSFLSLHHKKNITDWTTTEILLFYRTISPEKSQELHALFVRLDPVKYAGQKGNREHALEALSCLKRYITNDEL